MKNGCCGGSSCSEGDIERWMLELVKKHGNDPLKICREEGVRVIYVDDLRDDWDGFLYCDFLTCIIGINSRRLDTLRNVALAHELARYVIQKKVSAETVVDTVMGANLESLCNYGAKILLCG